MSAGCRFVNVYLIRRDHGRQCGVSRVSVPEAGHRGVNIQIPFGPFVAGISVGYFP